MAANNIALMPLQRESGADSYLSAIAQRQQMDTQAQANQRAQAQEKRAQSEFDINSKLRAVDILGAAIDQIPDGDAQKLNETVTWAVKTGLIDPNEAAQWNDVNKMPQIRAMSQQARALIAQRQKAEMDQKEFGLKEGLTAAQIAAQRANAAQSYASADAARALASQRSNPGMGGIDNTTFDNMSGLRKEFVGATKTYGDVRDAYGRIQASAQNPSAAGDLSLIFNYMKVLDPGSTVREGEFATAQNAAGIPERIVNAYNQALNGERLNEKQREDFVNRAGLLFKRQHETYLSTKNNYDTLAKRFGFDPSLVTFDQSGGIAPPADQPPQSFTPGGASGLGGAERDWNAEADRILGLKR